ncbi:G-protein coupled receptor family C group 5 member C-like [Discoglossus pictus]
MADDTKKQYQKMACRKLLLALFLMNYIKEAFTENVTFPKLDLHNISVMSSGCGQDLNVIYYGLCNLSVVWGIILEAMAGVGILVTFILAIIFLTLAPSVCKDSRKGCLAINFLFIAGVICLFSLVFAFILAPNYIICSIRKFLFGVLFAMCFACLIAHSVRLNYLALHNHGPSGCFMFLLAVGLFMVEAVINIEWLLITDVRNSLKVTDEYGTLCNITNKDFVTSLVYVMFLILASLLIPCQVLYGQYIHWKRHGRYIVLTTCYSIAIWVAWIVMYTYGNKALGYGKAWDDPVLAIALTSNAWVFVLFYIIPEIMEMRKTGYQSEEEAMKISSFVECPPSFFDNKAFTVENLDAPTAGNVNDRPISPYSGYNGLYPTLSLYPSEMQTVNHIHLPRVSLEPWRPRD